jgi:drug/metabolite transporter (DMT)-like permease
MPRHTAELLLLTITALWGGTFAIVKGAMLTTSPSAFVLLRFALAFGVALLLWPQAMRGWDARLVRRGLLLGAMYGVGFMLQTIGLTMTTASASAFITGTMVAFVPFVHRFVDQAAIRPNHIASIVLVLGGLWVFTAPDNNGVNLGDGLTLASAALWAFYLTYLDRWTLELHDEPQKQNALVILQFAATIIIAGVGSILMDDAPFRVEWSSALIWGLIYCGIFASVITTWVQTRFQRFTHPVRAGVIFAMEPIFAAIIAWFALHEGWTTREAIGAGILIAGVVGPDILAASRERFREGR